MKWGVGGGDRGYVTCMYYIPLNAFQAELMWSCWLLAGAQPEAHSHRSGASGEEQEEGEGVQCLPTQHWPAVAGRDTGGNQEEVQEGEIQNIKFLLKNKQLLTKYSLCVSVTSCQAQNILSV